MQRINMTYSVSEDEYNDELIKLLEAAESYIYNFSTVSNTSASLIESNNYEGSLKAMAQMRDALASADYRLHDIMNLIMRSLQQAESVPYQEQAETIEGQSVDVLDTEAASKQAEAIEDKIQQAKDNISTLGIDISDEQLEKLLRRKNDKAS